MLRIIVLGSAAGGGIPQWNCNCVTCRVARDAPDMHSGQVSLAVSADDGRHWFLINASPDLRQQVLATQQLAPSVGHVRHTPIAGVILTNGEVDAVAGLLSMREGSPFAIHANARVLDILAANPIFNVLNPERVKRLPMPLDEPFEPVLPDGTGSGLEVTAFEVPGKVAWYLERDASIPRYTPGDTVGLTLRARTGGPEVHVLTACAGVTPDLAKRLRGSALVFFDGTLWRDDEMIEAGLAQKTGQSMGHLSMSGPDGTIALLEPLAIDRKVFVHINNSNPALLPGSPERQAVEAAGWIMPELGQEFAT
ncbi:pyrroloquinoline quinone biosynthesis protein PqqB [Hoeflea ulvae]|uniref:Coenzyme PQQ synthesis protein B n=1 Tax=Hoeflea ulvae TaxID=2983764 RepID=A0ABT3YD53_9HYPH|nr:pyrroloquinoline quinone biosynthesis protein PqqB [Hoeflea ulvae]MCY0093818.1 pyrroloquinoline quinone biosynthesis protein PqqB [Hoeflea ulvae]